MVTRLGVPDDTLPTPRPFVLRLFGGLQLLPPLDATGDERSRAALLDNRRRVLALLTVLVLTPRPLSRDQLADYFWGDSDPARARHSLAEALRLLRRVFDHELFRARSNDLALDRDTPVVCDVLLFREAIGAGRDSDAVALYTADLLDGIYVERAPRFEDFIEHERSILKTQFADACTRETKRLAQVGDHVAAAQLARRWLQVNPLSTAAAESWLRAQLAPGTAESVRAAHEHFAAYTARLAADFETQPDRRVVKLLQDATDALAAHQASMPAGSTGVPRAAIEVRASPALGVPVAVDHRVDADSPAMVPTSVEVSRARRRWPWLLALPAAAALWFAARASDPTLVGSPDRRTLVVLADAENATSDSTLGMAITLASGAALGESDALQLISAARVRALRQLTTSPTDSAAGRGPLTESLARVIAMRAGASAVVVPVVLATGDQYRVALRIVKATDGVVLATVQSDIVAADGLLTALDDVVRDARRRFGGSRSEAQLAPPLPDYTTASLEALRAYAVGARSIATQDFTGAITAYRQAVALDSSFALAWTALGRALAYMNQPQAADSAFAVALRHQAHLSQRERVLVRAASFKARGFSDSAVAARAAWLRTTPDDREMLRLQISDLIAMSRRAEAASLAEAYVQRDSLEESVWQALAQAYEGEDIPTRRRAVAAFARVFVLDTTQWQNPLFPQLYGGLLARAQMYDSATHFWRQFDTRGPRLRGRAMRAQGQMELMRGEPRLAVAPLRTAVADGRTMGDTLSWVRSRLWLATALQSAGDTAAARRQLDTLVAEVKLIHEPQVQYWIGVQLVRLGRVADAQTVLAALERTMVPTSRVHQADRELLRAELATARGRAASVLPGLRYAMLADSSAISLETWGWVALQAGDQATATAAADAIFARVPGFGFEGWLARDRARVWRGVLSQSNSR